MGHIAYSRDAVAKSRSLVFTVFAVIAALGISACQAPSKTAETMQQAPAPSAVEQATSQSADPTPTATPVSTDLVPLGHFLRKKPFGEDNSLTLTSPSEVTFVGRAAINLDAQALFPQWKVVSEAYTSLGTEDKPMIGAVVVRREAANGLNPEAYVASAVLIDPVGPTVVHATDISSASSQKVVSLITGSNSTVLAIGMPDTTGNSENRPVSGFDVATGAQVWSKTNYGAPSAMGIVTTVEKGAGTQKYESDTCYKYTTVDVTTGKDMASIDQASLDPTNCSDSGAGFVGDIYGSQPPSKAKVYFTIRIFNHSAAINPYTGTTAQVRYDQTVDPLTGFAYPIPTAEGSPEKSPFGVVDPVPGKIVWQIPTDQASKLDAQMTALFGGKAYVKTTDQNLVVDVSTGTTVTASSSRYPVALIDSWTLWSDGSLEKTVTGP